MGRNYGLFRLKIEYENVPITDVKVKGIEGFDEAVRKVKEKFKGCK